MKRLILPALVLVACGAEPSPSLDASLIVAPDSGVLLDCPGPCTAIDSCHLDGVCDRTTGRCTAPLAPDDTACDDGLLCTENDRCSAGVCAGSDKVCAAEESCLFAGACDPSTGSCTQAPKPDETSCDDGDPCTSGDVCFEGVCLGPLETECEDRGPCLALDRCEPFVGCQYVPAREGFRCDDRDACTLDDRCKNGVCAASSTISCNDVEACRPIGACDPQTGQCSYPTLADGASCSDGNACTGADSCFGGICSGDFIPHGGAFCSEGVCFSDVTTQAGVTWTSSIPTGLLIGATAGLFDYDSDGRLDLILGTERDRLAVYRNLGGERFTDVSAQLDLPRLLPTEWLMGAIPADYDNDGDDDLYLLVWGRNRLLRNDRLRFTDVTASSGTGAQGWNTSAAFADYDKDGDLDLYVGNYIFRSAGMGLNHAGGPNVLYQNNGDGTFTDVTIQKNVGGNGTTLSALFTDYDGDGDLDLLVCNDFGAYVEPNLLFQNDGNGDFVEVGASLGADLEIFCMGTAIGDYDRDGDLDYYFTNLGRNVLLQNNGAAGFSDVATTMGVELTFDRCFPQLFTTSWGTAFHDLDQDGWLDLYVANGHIPAYPFIANALESPDSLFLNRGAGQPFRDVSVSAGVDDPAIGRGSAFGDWDQDGDLDLLQVSFNAPPRLYRNDSPSLGNGLRVDLHGRISPRDPIGARLAAAIPGATLIREMQPIIGYLGASEKTVHFGLGNAVEASTLHIRWPSSIEQTLVHVPASMSIEVTEPLVTISTATIGPAIAGQPLEVSIALGGAAEVTHRLELRFAGNSSSSAEGTITIAGAARIRPSIAIPPNPPQAGELIVTVSDAGGGVDQRALPITVTR